MSFEPDNNVADESVIDLLKELIRQIKLLNVRIEEAFDTKIKDHDL